MAFQHADPVGQSPPCFLMCPTQHELIQMVINSLTLLEPTFGRSFDDITDANSNLQMPSLVILD